MKIDIFNTDRKYSVIYADPPWDYSDKNCGGAAAPHYNTLKLKELMELPIEKIAEKNAVLFMWATYPKIEAALQLIKAWGFTYKSIAFQWVKLNRGAKVDNLQIVTIKDLLKTSCFFGLGRWTRGNTECCLLAIKGKPKRISAKVGQLIFSPLRRHSEKPPETRDKIVEQMGELPRIELFARQQVEEWDCWGNEV